MEPKTKIIDQGLIFYADVLGYKNMLKSIDLEQYAKTVLSVFNEFQKKGIDEVLVENGLERETVELMGPQVFGKFDKMIVSDTILIFFDPKNDDINKYAANLFLFVIYVSIIFRYFFQEGLPLRGGLCWGKYLISENMFAGKEIVTSHEIASRLNFSGIVISDDADKHFRGIFSESKSWILSNYSKCIHKCRYNLNDGNFATGILINWILKNQFKDCDIKTEVIKAFSGHKKNIGDSVLSKIENTVQTILQFQKQDDTI